MQSSLASGESGHILLLKSVFFGKLKAERSAEEGLEHGVPRGI
jgi:hypothetical protein